MQLTDISNPQERKKLIWAVGLGIAAILLLWWTFIGFGGSQPARNRNTAVDPARPSNPRPRGGRNESQTNDQLATLPMDLREVVYPSVLPSSEAKRNIFVFYEKPQATAGPVQTPTPTPPPPLLLASLSPANVFARTDDFTLEVTGDKFAPGIRINIDGRELTTRFVSPQQLSATVPASIIANPGGREVAVRSFDGKLYSNSATLNVNPPPTPNYAFIGILRYQRQPDIAILQDKNNRETLNVQRGDVLAGRFRLTSISEKEVVFTDTSLKIKHPIAFSTERERGMGPLSRPTPRVESEDDEP
jgi:IPT/TIG domain